MILYVNGCSHTDDLWLVDENVNRNYIWPCILMNKITTNYDYFRVQGNSFIKRPYNEVSKTETSINLKLENDTLINDSVSGAGNDYIFHNTLESIDKLIKNNNKPDFVIIQWSGPNRREYCESNGDIKFVTPHDNPELGLKFEPMGSLHTIHYMYILQTFLERMNIKYIFINYFGLDVSIKKSNLFNKIKSVDFGNQTIFNGILPLIMELGLNRDEQGHSNELGSQFIVKNIFELISF